MTVWHRLKRIRTLPATCVGGTYPLVFASEKALTGVLALERLHSVSGIVDKAC